MTSRPSVRRIQVDGRELVAKSATGAGRALLRREAELCTCLEGSGVVSIVALRESDDRTDLVTESAGDLDLSAYESLDPMTLRRALVTAVAAVERLHERGWTHGAICAEHLVVDRAGTSTLCSLGSARPLDRTTASSDAAQLRRVIRHVVERPPRGWGIDERARWRRWARSVRRTIDSTAGDRSDHGSDDRSDGAAELAGLRASLVAADDRMHRRNLPDVRRTRIAATTGLAILLVLGGAAAVLRQGDVAATRAPTADAATEAGAGVPAADRLTEDDPPPDRDGCEPPAPDTPRGLDLDGNGCPDDVVIDRNLVKVDAATFRVGDPGDDLSLGDWDCDGVPTVLLLRPGSGEVFHFSWAEQDRPTTGHLITIVEGATSLSSVPDEHRCDEAMVQRTVGSAIAVPIEQGATDRPTPERTTVPSPLGILPLDNTSPDLPGPDGPGTDPPPDGGAP